MLIRDFDRWTARLGYASRAEIFTAFAYCLIDKAQEQKDSLVFTSALALKENVPFLSEHRIQKKLQDLIDSMMKPVIAVRGVKAAADAAWTDIQDAFHEENGIWLTEEEIREGFYQYDLLNKCKLREYALSLHHKEGDTDE